KKYLQRIGDIDKQGPSINSVIEINPDALGIARDLDRERKDRGPRGPLHGIPILIKDNIDTHDRMTTTAGSLALQGSVAPRDSFVVQRLREAGALVLGKTNLSEWANFRSTRSTSGWSGRGGQTKNPYVLARNPSGSSSGSGAAVAANLCAAAVGTETDGSIVSPSSFNGIVGIKPTLGLVSRAGIIPIAHSQDTAGPMARTVADAAALLGVITGIDSRDSVTSESRGKAHHDYTQFLDPRGLRGARIGVARKFFKFRAGTAKIFEDAIEGLKNAGATIIDPADIPSHGKFGDTEQQVLHYEFKAGLNKYLAGLGPDARVRTLEEIIDFNERNRDKEMPWFGQETMIKSQEKGPLTEKEYVEAREKCRRLSRDEGIDAVMKEHQLDAIVAPTTGPAHVTDYIYGDRDTGGSSWPAAVSGYPNITVPAGFIFGLPVGLSFFGRPYTEPTLIKLAFAFEQLTKVRQSPKFLASGT
ncbi:MAG TPA: amidase, partial [Candidatus Binatia bacterium]|nr:amidase [Candidatus Binatia bacterium]